MIVAIGIFDLLKDLVGDRVFPDKAPFGTPRPYITYQKIGGGQSVNYVSHEKPTSEHGIYQVNVWDDTRLAADAIARQVEDAFRSATAFNAEPVAPFSSDHEADSDRYGTIQDFSIWSDT